MKSLSCVIRLNNSILGGHDKAEYHEKVTSWWHARESGMQSIVAAHGRARGHWLVGWMCSCFGSLARNSTKTVANPVQVTLLGTDPGPAYYFSTVIFEDALVTKSSLSRNELRFVQWWGRRRVCSSGAHVRRYRESRFEESFKFLVVLHE